MAGTTRTPSVPPIPATAAPAATEAPEARYLAIAKAGIKTPSLRSTLGYPAGEWSAQAMTMPEGPIVIINFPISPGTSKEQTVRFAKLQCAQIVTALFTEATELCK